MLIPNGRTYDPHGLPAPLILNGNMLMGNVRPRIGLNGETPPIPQWEINFKDGLWGYNLGKWVQTYTGTRFFTTIDGNLRAGVNNDPILDYVGGLALRMEPAAANILLEVVTDWTKSALTTVTKDAVSWQGAANGAWTIVAGGADATVISTAVAGSSAAFTFVVAMKRSVGTGAVSMTVDNGTTWTAKTLTTSFQYFNVTKTAATPQLGFKLATSGDEIIVDCLMLVPNTAIASSYFAPAAAIGAELVTNGNFAAVTEAEAAAGVTVVGNCYKILQRTDIDYTADGAPNNNVGTYFNSTVGGATIDGSGGNDRLNNVTATGWTAGVGWAPQATAGALTGKMQKIAGTASTLTQTSGIANVINNVYRVSMVSTVSAGYTRQLLGGGYTASAGADGTSPVWYNISIATGSSTGIYGSVDFAGTIDDFSVMTHGTVRISEANSITLTTPAAVSAALAGSFTIAMKIRFPHAKAAVSAASTLLTFVNTVNTGLYQTSAGVFTVSDGVNTATNDDAFIANTDYILAWRGKADTLKMDVGLGLPGAVAFDAEGTYAGSVPTTGDVTYLMKAIGQGGAHIQWIKGYNRVLETAQINAM